MQVWADGESLRCSAPVGTLTADLRQTLRQNKPEILAFLRSADSVARQSSAIVSIQSQGSLPPIFGTAGHNGDVFCYRALAHHLGADQPLFGLRPPGLDSDTPPLDRVEKLAAYFAAEIRAFHPQGEFVIAGFCAGGAVAFELARQLEAAAAAPNFLALFGAPYVTSYRRWPKLRRWLVAQVQRVVRHTRALVCLSGAERRAYLAERLGNRSAPTPTHRSTALETALRRRAQVERATFAALRRYNPGRFTGRLKLFLPSREWVHSSDLPLRWRQLAEQVEEFYGPDGCLTDLMLLEPYAATFAELFTHCS
ncbi:MAG: thioesterase [Verrucomicrobia bacterium]|nr:MAG: thioesterase [Verrucomicrobiota bacterium]